MCVLAGAALTASLAQAAAHLGDRALRMGASGPDVRELQRSLGKVGFEVKADGQFGSGTKRAVKQFQSASRLTPSGTVGRKTVAALKQALRGGTANVNGGYGEGSAKQKTKSLGDRIPVTKGMSGHDVRVLQAFLNRVGVKTPVDGEFGTGTEKAVKAFETAASRTVDGVVDAGDIGALRTLVGKGATVSAPAPAPAQPAPLAPGDMAQVGPDGLAVAPANAADPVKAIIAAGNVIAKMPYTYGGGHGNWNDSGYDCSGSVSYALHGAGLLGQALPSGDFMSWGDPGPGQWVTLYAKPSHMYMVVAGIRFDTSGRSNTGSRWQTDMRPTDGYTVIHPTGL